MKFRVLTVALAVAACGPTSQTGEPESRRPVMNQPTGAEVARAAEQFITLRDEFLAGYYEGRPVRATELGIHQYNDQLPPVDRRGVQQWIDQLLEWMAALERIPFSYLEGDDRFDYGIMEYALRGELIELEEVRSWARDPRVYTAMVASGIASVAERPYAPVDERVPALIARMDAAVHALDAARESVSNPPAVWTELAAEETRGLIGYLETDLAALLSAQTGVQGDGARLPPQVEPARDRLVAALRDHLAWLESDLLPRSTGDFRLGRYLFERKLLYDEHIALEAPELDRLNERAIEEYQGWLARVAAEIDPDRTPRSILDSIARHHPEPEELLETARTLMESVHAWVDRAGVVPLLAQAMPVVRESPPYARMRFASLDAPGPFETEPLPAFYNITNVRPEWTEDEAEQHLSYFNYPGLLGVTVHETFPGHHVQRAYLREVPSELRRVFTARSFAEGWAHYAERMVLDAGFSRDDPAVRLAQLRRALEHHARWYAALHLHAMGAPLEEVVERFMEIAHLEEFPARREVLRATYDPTYMVGALGRMQIIELRDDYEEWLEERDESFQLSEFHDRLLRLALPMPLAREALMPIPEPGPRARQLIRRR